jgi:hypothetical protein
MVVSLVSTTELFSQHIEQKSGGTVRQALRGSSQSKQATESIIGSQIMDW